MAKPADDHTPVAVIDIGSNSVRLAVFRNLDRTLLPVYNEKVMCALAKGMEKSRALNPKGAGLAVEAIQRFTLVARGMGIEDIHVLGTAALRDAVDGKDFAKKVTAETGLKVRILTGEEEAFFAACGVRYGTLNPEGIAGDLGGGSLELADVKNDHIHSTTTLPLGPLLLMDAADSKLENAARIVDAHFSKINWLGSMHKRQFYAVGGAWRAFAKAHMAESGYPVHVVHGYTIKTDDALAFAQKLKTLTPEQLEKVPGIGKKRAEVMPYAALLIEKILRYGQPESIVFSAYGVREGYLFDRLGAKEQTRDPLLEYANTEPNRFGRKSASRVLGAWTDKLFKNESPDLKRLRETVCALSDTNWSEHPDYRADAAFHHTLSLPIGGMDHEDRAFIALAMYCRYAGADNLAAASSACQVLQQEWREQAIALGLTLRFAYGLSGGAASVLKDTALSIKGDELIMAAPKAKAALFTDSNKRRLQKLSKALNLKEKIVFD